MTKCMMNDATMAVIREGFRQGGITNKLWFSLKLKVKHQINDNELNVKKDFDE